MKYSVAAILATTTFAYEIPIPTKYQLAYQQQEIVALIHFNMATFVQDGDPGCTSENWLEKSANPLTFKPTELDVNNWADSMDDVGISSAVLTAKHGCGFSIWQTDAVLPSGSPYTYKVGTPELDVIDQFSSVMEERGIGHGFYYSLTNNFYLNVCLMNAGCVSDPLPGQLNVTQDEYHTIVVSQVTELWTKYGHLTEIWFDGGFDGDLKTLLLPILKEHQPNVIGMNGGKLVESAARWVGTESEGMPLELFPNGVFSTYCCNASDPVCVVSHSDGCSLNDGDDQSAAPYGGAGCIGEGCDDFYPAGLDWTLQENDVWFWEPDLPLRSLDVMKQTYHDSVGRNTVLELAFSIDQRGKIDEGHADLYKEFGGWIRKCYGEDNSVGLITGQPGVSSYTVTYAESVDRIVIREDQTKGQRIKSFTITNVDSGQELVSGDGIGNKRIELLGGETAEGATFRFDFVSFDEESFPVSIKKIAGYKRLNC